MNKIFIDPGHGETDSGAIANGLVEKDINLIVALEVKRLLELHNIEVKLSRENDVKLSLLRRSAMANIWGADYFISIHHNAGGGDGYEIIHSINEGKGKELAQKIGKEFENIGQNKRRIYSRKNSRGTDYYAVIRSTKMPAVITEFAFIDSTDKNIVDEEIKLKLEAEAIANGILKQLGITLMEDDFNIAIDKLVSRGIINSPEYWIKNDNYKTEYVRELIKKVAAYID